MCARTLSSSEAQQLTSTLQNDAGDYAYSSIVSLGDALKGIDEARYTWATIKLYYSSFYAIRARLAIDKICLFYVKQTPFSVFARAGECPNKEKGQTHKIVLNLFRRHRLEQYFLSQSINLDEPLDWLINRREEANYKRARFVEPGLPDHFVKISSLGIRKACGAYLSDHTGLYMFDPEHAMVAYPLLLAARICELCRSHGVLIQDEEHSKFVRRLFSDGNGPIPCLLKALLV